MKVTINFPDFVKLRAPKGMPDAIKRAARQHHQTPPEWARQVLLRALDAQGVQLCNVEHQTGRQQ